MARERQRITIGNADEFPAGHQRRQTSIRHFARVEDADLPAVAQDRDALSNVEHFVQLVADKQDSDFFLRQLARQSEQG